MAHPEVQVHVVQGGIFHGILKVGVRNAVDPSIRDILESATAYESTPTVIGVWCLHNVALRSKSVYEVLSSSCPDHERCRIMFISDHTHKTVVQANPDSGPLFTSIRPSNHSPKRDRHLSSPEAPGDMLDKLAVSIEAVVITQAHVHKAGHLAKEWTEPSILLQVRPH